MQNIFQEYSIEYEHPFVVKYSVSCLLWNILLHRIFIFYRIFLKHILHVYPSLAWKFHAWNICPSRQAARKIAPWCCEVIFLAAFLQGHIFYAKVPMNTYLKARVHCDWIWRGFIWFAGTSISGSLRLTCYDLIKAWETYRGRSVGCRMEKPVEPTIRSDFNWSVNHDF